MNKEAKERRDNYLLANAYAVVDHIEKEAILIPAAIGAGTGALMAGENKGSKGAGYGAIKAILTDVGAGTGIAAGALIGSTVDRDSGILPGAVLGGLAGATGGWLLGTPAAEAMTGTTWDKIRTDKQPAEPSVQKTAADEEESSPLLDGYLAGYMHKEAGAVSELIGANVNPLTAIGNPIGAGAAALTDTRTVEEQKAAEKETAGNLLLPGRGAYNAFKRYGATNNSLANKGAESPYLSTATEMFGGAPAAIATGGATSVIDLAGALMALTTKTRNTKEQLSHEKDPSSNWKNLIPGVGSYNLMKRIGYSRSQFEDGYGDDKKKKIEKKASCTPTDIAIGYVTSCTHKQK